MTPPQGPTGPAIVTGGGQGLGRAFCLSLATETTPVVVADIDGAKAESVAKEIRERGGTALAAPVDVADEESVAEMIKKTMDQFGPPVSLVNNAAIFSSLTMGPFTDIELEQWQQVLDVNVTGSFLCCRSVVPVMADAGYGKIVNISSATVWTGRPGYLHYVTSKAALIGFTRALAAEVGEMGIRVNAVTPGSTVTEVPRATIDDAARQAMANQTALRRVQRPDDIIGTIQFLTSPASDFITGQSINVDGGLVYH